MAVRALTHSSSMAYDLATWAGLATTDTGAPAPVAGGRGLAGSIQFTGTFGGATARLEGSNDGTTYATLKDTQGLDIELTAPGIREFSTACLYIRPSVTGGAGVTIGAFAALQG